MKKVTPAFPNPALTEQVLFNLVQSASAKIEALQDFARVLIQELELNETSAETKAKIKQGEYLLNLDIIDNPA